MRLSLENLTVQVPFLQDANGTIGFLIKVRCFIQFDVKVSDFLALMAILERRFHSFLCQLSEAKWWDSVAKNNKRKKSYKNRALTLVKTLNSNLTAKITYTQNYQIIIELK